MSQRKESITQSIGSLFSSKSFHYADLDQHIKEVSKQELLRQYLPFLAILSDHKTVLTKNHSLIRVLKITGIDNSNISADEKRDFGNIRNNLLSSVGSDTQLNFYTIRRELPEVDDEVDLFENQQAEHISRVWHSQFRKSFVTQTYLVISRNFPNLSKNLDQFVTKLNAARKEFDFYTNQMCTLLSKYGAIDLHNDGISGHNKHHELFRFFSYLVNCYKFNSKSETELFNHLSLSDISFNTSSGLIKIVNDRVKKFSKIIGVRVVDEEKNNKNYSDENLLRSILTLNHEFTLVQQTKHYTKESNRKYFIEKKKTLDQLPKFAAIQSRINELDEASELIESNNGNFLDYSFYIKVYGDSEEELEDALASIQNTLAGEGVSSVSETIGVFLTFVATLPDMAMLLCSLQTSIRSRITTKNAADFISLSSAKEGFRRSPFGEMPVVDFKTISTSGYSGITSNHSGNYSFTFHQDDISDRASGHTMVIGQTGTGKSTLMAFLLMNCLKFQNIKILCFDSLQGLKLPVTAFGGEYITVGKDLDLKLNPMSLPDSFVNRNFQKRFIEILAGGIEEKEGAIIEEVLRQNYSLNDSDRCLKNLKLAFDLEGFDNQSNRPTIASRMKKWIGRGDVASGEIYSRFFNNAEDNLNFSSNIVAFDMGEVLKDLELLTPTSFYIFHKFNQIIDQNPSPHIFFVDEMQKYLQSPSFNPHIISTIKESRKRNGIFIGCMQEASTLVDSPNGDEIISNLATLIIFPNSKARAEHYIDGLNLTDSEFEFVKNHPNPRHVLIKKKDGHSVIVDADLSTLGAHLKLFSSKDTDRKKMESLIEEESSNWVDHYLEVQK